MFFRILGKELKNKKGINAILFIFILIATIFVASSVNNILVVTNATQYSMDKGKVPDDMVYTYEGKESTQVKLTDWLDSDGQKYIENYKKHEFMCVSLKSITEFNGRPGSEYDNTCTILIQPSWDDYLTAFNQNKKDLKINDGEIAIPQSDLDRNGLQIGDTITFKVGDLEKEFKITEAVIDPSFSGDYIGMVRYFISDNDYQELANNTDQFLYVYCVNTDNVKTFSREMKQQDANIIVEISKQNLKLTYAISLISAGILIIIGICLIIIAFLILRFTIVVTLQENYREIGIQKAIGMKNKRIKRIYMVKYLALAFVAGVLGCIASFPVSSLMIDLVSKNIMMEDGAANVGVNIICSVLVLLLVLLFCYLCTNKVRKFSAVEAIRSGETGERYRKKAILTLHKHKKSNIPFFMAVNDILSNFKRYIVLLLTFIIGTILIILPLNTVTSLQSEEMIKSFVMDTDCDVFLNPDSVNNTGMTIISNEDINNSIKELNEKFSKKGYDADFNVMVYITASLKLMDSDEVYTYTATKPFNSDGEFIELTGGSIPKLPNEIVLSERIMDATGLKIGDSTILSIYGKESEVVITGSYQNYIQMGESILLSPAYDTTGLLTGGTWYYESKISNVSDKTKLLKDVSDDFPEYDVYSAKEALGRQLGSTLDQLGTIKAAVVAIICGINILITVLMMKIFIISEKGQIGMLRSIGFNNRKIKAWLVSRMGIILVAGVIIGAVISKFLNNIVLRPIFGMMGDNKMKIVVNPVEAYMLIPGLLLVVVILSAYISSASIRKMNLMEINNID